jgi:hypothetical protein
MKRDWEEYKIGPAENRKRLHVTLSAKGEILIGAKTFDRIGRPDAAVLLFDKAGGSIGVRPAHPRQPNAYLLEPKSKGRHRVIRASAFCRNYGIRVQRTTVFNHPEFENGVLVLDLNATTGLEPRATRSR